MSFRKNLKQVLAIIKNGYKMDKKSVTCSLSNNTLNFLTFLLDQGYINGFAIQKPLYSLDIYLKYSRFGSPIAFYFNHIAFQPMFTYLRLKKLRRFYFHSYVCILSTNIGLLSGDKAVFFNRGGLYLFKL